MNLIQRIKQQRAGNSIEQVKNRLLKTYAIIALASSFLVFLSFSIYLVLNEDAQIQRHLQSFENVAIQYYQLDKSGAAQLSPYVSAFYSEEALTDKLKAQLPYEKGVVTRFRSFEQKGFMVYHIQFKDELGEERPLYLSVDARAMEFGDDSWDALMLISMGLMLFLIGFLRYALKRVFDGLMSPISELSQQLKSEEDIEFSVNERSIDEVQQLTRHLNRYKHMKERVSKQELMFAKYASHELKTPISIVLGAANLQGMKDDPSFQNRQRERILTAATNMQNTVEVLLSIVKQENVSDSSQPWTITESDLQLDDYRKKVAEGVVITSRIETDCAINFPQPVIRMIVKNLVENAIRFTQVGEIQVVIQAGQIQVIDSGVGLTDSAETEHGLGLLIVKRLCQSYGWQFELKNRESGMGCVAELRKQ